MGKGGKLVSSQEDGMVSVPPKGSVSSGVGAVINVVRTGGCVWGGVGVAANMFWLIISFHGCKIVSGVMNKRKFFDHFNKQGFGIP